MVKRHIWIQIQAIQLVFSQTCEFNVATKSFAIKYNSKHFILNINKNSVPVLSTTSESTTTTTTPATTTVNPIQCAQGTHLFNNECVQNVCKCENGTPSTGSKCKVHGETRCNSCNFPYDFSCSTDARSNFENHSHDHSHSHSHHVHKRDTHGNSGGGSYSYCRSWADQDGSNCKACERGYEWNSELNICEEIKCYCDNGTPIGTYYDGPWYGGQECTNSEGAPRHTYHKCNSCDEGYELKKKGTSKIWQCDYIPTYDCYCENGTPITGDIYYEGNYEGQVCVDNQSKHKCQSCDEGYHLERAEKAKVFQCVETPVYDCFCDNGVAITGNIFYEGNHGGQVCVPNQSLHKCQSCNEGYELVKRCNPRKVCYRCKEISD